MIESAGLGYRLMMIEFALFSYELDSTKNEVAGSRRTILTKVLFSLCMLFQSRSQHFSKQCTIHSLTSYFRIRLAMVHR